MVKGLLFHWEPEHVDTYSGIDAVGSAWIELAYAFNIKLAVIETIPFNRGREDVLRFTSFADFLEKNPSENLILLCPHSESETVDVDDDYWLCVGSANGWGDVSKEFKTLALKPTPLAGYYGIFAAHIALHKLK